MGEGDFVLAHPDRGLLVLEVKGGRIEQRDGRWYTNGVAFDRAPLDQAHGFVRKLVRRLLDWNCEPPAFGAALVFPDTDFDVQPTEDVLKGVVVGRSHLPWLGDVLPGVVERALPAAGPSRGGWIERLHQMWGETWVPSLSLGTRILGLGERRFALDPDQLEVLDTFVENDRVLVQGGAGSGKTLLAAEVARRHAAAGQRVLLLCFTQPLRTWLAERLSGTGVEVQTVSGLAKRIVDAADGLTRTPDAGNEYWRRTYERAGDVCRPEWDAVVVDEGQDLTFEAWCLVGGLARGRRLWAFHDPGQGFWEDRSPPADLFQTRCRLKGGRRCPPGIEALAQKYLGRACDEAAIAAARREGTLRVVPCPDAAEAARGVGDEIDRLLSQGVALPDIGVVSLRGQTAEGAVHHQATLGRHSFVHAEDPQMGERLVADTFLRWKGLERPVIIVADVAPGDVKSFGTRMHIALSRALVAVRIVASPVGEGGWPGM